MTDPDDPFEELVNEDWGWYSDDPIYEDDLDEDFY